jgi:hypothetical protein
MAPDVTAKFDGADPRKIARPAARLRAVAITDM